MDIITFVRIFECRIIIVFFHQTSASRLISCAVRVISLFLKIITVFIYRTYSVILQLIQNKVDSLMLTLQFVY